MHAADSGTGAKLSHFIEKADRRAAMRNTFSQEITYVNDTGRVYGFDCSHVGQWAPSVHALTSIAPGPNPDEVYVDYDEARRITEEFADSLVRIVSRLCR